MSENQDVVRRVFDAFNRGDIDGVVASLDPQIEWHVPPMLPEQTVYHGHEGVRELWRSLSDSFEAIDLVTEEFVEAGDQVMVLAAVRGRGKGSGAEVQSPSFAWVWTLRRRRAVRLDVYPNRAEGLQALAG